MGRVWTVVVVALLAVACGSEAPPSVDPDAVETDGGLRTETWDGLSVDVPADWWYGGAPMWSHGAPRERLICADGAPPDATQRGTAVVDAPGVVGRPIQSSDVCSIYPWITHAPQLRSVQPYVWLGAAVEPGIVRYEGGLVQETVELHGTTLTVGSTDASQRREILDSARPAEGCGTGGVEPGVTEVCGFDRDPQGRLVLAYAAQVAPSVLTSTAKAAEQAPLLAANASCRFDPGDLVVVRDGDDSIEFELGCGTIDIGDGARRSMTEATVTPWASPAIRTTLFSWSRDDNWRVRYFIGPQG